MFKGKFVVLSLIAVALLCWQILPTTVDTVNSGIVEPCSSSASSAGGCVLVCPAGDGDRLDATGATISVVVKDQAGAPIPGIPGADFWLMGCNPDLVLCGGGGSINANAATDINGETEIVGDFAAGGCDSVGVVVVVQGVVIEDINNNCNALCLPVVMVSPDIDGSLLVDVVDLGLFSRHYTAPVPKGYVACLDYNCDGAIDLVDFSLFSQHYLHFC